MRNDSTRSNQDYRLPPHDKDAERAVLGIVLTAATILPEAQTLRPGEFYGQRHSQLWAAMQRLDAKGQPIDIITLKALLTQYEPSESAERIAAELASLLDGGWIRAHVDFYVQIIRKKSALRDAIERSNYIIQLAHSAPDDIQELVALAEKQVAVLHGHRAGANVWGFPLRTWDLSEAAMKAQENIDWLIEPILAQPDVMSLVGDGGVGKSKSAAAVALAVAFGKPLWGHFEVRRHGRVIYINEERPDLTVRHLHTLAPALAIDPSEITKRIVLLGRGDKPLRITDRAAREALIRLVKQLGDVNLIIWDSLHVLHDKEENDNAQMTEVIEHFRSVCMQTTTCGIILHHTGKNDYGNSGLSARGATAIKDTVDAQFVIRRPDNNKVDVVRIAQDKTRRALVPPFMLKLEHDDRGDVLSVQWVGKAPTKAEQALPAVLEVISSSEVPLKSGDIALKLAKKRIRKDDVYAALALVRAKNLARWSGNETRGFIYGVTRESSED